MPTFMKLYETYTKSWNFYEIYTIIYESFYEVVKPYKNKGNNIEFSNLTPHPLFSCRSDDTQKRLVIGFQDFLVGADFGAGKLGPSDE